MQVQTPNLSDLSSNGRLIPNSVYDVAMAQFPKRCKKCHRVFYDFSDWFIDHSLGVPMPFKKSSLLFFRACQCQNTLALSVDFGETLNLFLKTRGSDLESLAEFRNIFVSEISMWKRETGNLINNRNVMINITDSNQLERILKVEPGTLKKSEGDDFYEVRIPKWEDVNIFVYDGVENFMKTLRPGFKARHKVACGIFFIDNQNIDKVLNVINEVKAIDPNFQSVTVSDTIKNVSIFNLDDNFHFSFDEHSEAIPFLIVNRLNSYFYLQ